MNKFNLGDKVQVVYTQHGKCTGQICGIAESGEFFGIQCRINMNEKPQWNQLFGAKWWGEPVYFVKLDEPVRQMTFEHWCSWLELSDGALFDENVRSIYEKQTPIHQHLAFCERDLVLHEEIKVND
jgi:hypothetical protein